MDTVLELNEKTCRICLSSKETSNSIFDIVELEEKIELKDVLDRVTNVKVLEVEFYAPTRICNECTINLLDAYDFVSRVERTERLLRDHHLEANPHTEENEDLDDDKVSEGDPLDNEFEIIINEELSSVQETIIAEKQFSFESLQSRCSSRDSEEILEEQFKIALEEEKLDLTEDTQTSSNVMMRGRNLDQNSQIDKERRPLRKSTWHNCNQCNRSFAKVLSLERHLKLAHTYASPEEIAAVVAMIPNAPKEAFHCCYCPRTFVRKENLTRHVQMVHNEKADEDTETDIKRRHKYKRGLCPYCGESFSQASLIVHIRRHTGETPYKCDDCDAGFPRRQDLIIHKRKHTGERPHVCTVCGKSFARPNKLTRHMRIHTGERPYKCTKCDRSFAQSNDLTIHIRRHTGEKPYKCSVCGDGFISGSALKSHQKIKEHELKESKSGLDPYEKVRVNNRKRLLVTRMLTEEETIDEEV